MRILFSIAATLVLALTAAPVKAQEFPTKPISLIVPYTAGGPYDILARFMSEALRKKDNVATIVEAKPGGNTLIGIQHTLKQPNDGHTLLISTLPIMANLILMKNPGYKYEDFVPVGPVAKHPYILFVPASLPVNNLAELVAYGQKNPGKLNIGALSPGGQVQMLADKFIKASKIKIEKIPYKGAAELATALLTGDLQMSFFAYSAGAPFLKDGKLKPIAIASDERSPLTPDIATFKELGMAGVTGDSWVALFARADTPKPVIAKLQTIITQASKDPEYIAKIRNAGNDPWVIAPDAMNDFIKEDFKFWEPDLKLIEPQ
jgi:tripartite-type tricarboxylate transporter receptor subunit TctC